HIERTLGIPHPFQRQTNRSRRSQRHEMARGNHPRVSVRASAVLLGRAIEQGDAMAALRGVVRRTKPDYPAADDGDAFCAQRIPQQYGSRSSRISVASELTYADPRMTGWMSLSTMFTCPSNRLPMMLSCRHGLPS